MPVYEAEAIVLRQYSLFDSDRIVVFLTNEFGKVRAVARGVKRPKSRMGGCLEPLNHIKLEFYAREGRELGQIRQAELIHSYLGKQTSLSQICAFNYFAEIANEIVQDNQPNHRLFRLFLASLKAGEGKGASEELIRYFEIWSLRLNGLFPDYGYCSNCGKCVKDDGFFAWFESCQARCSLCSKGRGLRIGAAASSALAAMMRLSPDEFMNSPLDRAAAAEIERLSQRLLSFHLEKQLKSYRVLQEMVNNQ